MNKLKDMPKKAIKASKKKASNIKNANIFNINYIPKKIYVRKELNDVTKVISDYLVLNTQNHLIIYGTKGSGKTVSIISLMKSFKDVDKSIKYYYINAREFSTSYKIYQHISKINKRGFSISDIRKNALKNLKEKTIVIIDEVDFLKDLEILYRISRETKSNLIILTQKIQWYKTIKDESIRSSLQPTQIVFNEYIPTEIQEILEMRATDGLYEWNKTQIALMSGLLARDHHSDVRIGIKTLFKIGMENLWNDDLVYENLEQASKEVENEIIKNLNDRDLIILFSLLRCKDTNKAYTYALNFLDEYEMKYLSMSKTHFFRIINYLQNLGIISLIKKRIKRYYTTEVQIILSKPSLVKEELEKRINM
jgi:cell division control protein 6